MLLCCIEDVHELHFNPRERPGFKATLGMNRYAGVIDGVSGTTQNTKMLLINSEKFSTLPHITEGKIKYQLFPSRTANDCLSDTYSHTHTAVALLSLQAAKSSTRFFFLTFCFTLDK